MRWCLKLGYFLSLLNLCTSDGKSTGDIEHSTAEECLRPCTRGAPRKFCHYKWHLEMFPAVNKACNTCKPSITQSLLNNPTCECILADGIERTVFSVNRMLPGPQIQACKDDFIIVDVTNDVEGTEATLHWHGLFQTGYQYYDGVPFVTQCPIVHLQTFTYQFHLNQSGTYFWHSHVSHHRLDGQYGALIIREPPQDDPHAHLYDVDDAEHVILISDWMHQLSAEYFPGILMNPGQAAENVLINGVGTFQMDNGTVTDVDLAKFTVEKGARYRFRLINAFTTVCLAQFNIEHHEFLVIAQDGMNVEPKIVNTIITSSGERVDFVINANQTIKSYWIQVRALGECEPNGVQQLAILEYKGDPVEKPSREPKYKKGLRHGMLYNPLDGSCGGIREDTVCPSDFRSVDENHPDLLREQPDIRFVISFSLFLFEDRNALDVLFSANNSNYVYPFLIGGAKRVTVQSLMDDVVFQSAAAPPLTQKEGFATACNGKDSPICQKNPMPDLPCRCTNIKPVPLDSIVEVVLYDQLLQPALIHPFHLHGYKFQLFDMGRFEDDKFISKEEIQTIIDQHDARLRNGSYHSHQPSKDTVLVPQGGWVIFRFRASNPGIWMFHCHFDYHHTTGMLLLFNVGTPEDLPPVPPGFPRCGNFTPPVDFHD